MSSLAAQVTPTGITAPNFQTILQALIDTYKTIYGQDIYLGDDSQDFEFLSLIASAINDSNQGLVSVYNSFPPTFAQGTGLSSMVKLNGITRNVATNSTAPAVIGGDIGTVINNGVARDKNGALWNLPALVTIPPSGEITVTVTAQQAGAIAADIGVIDTIYTPVLGWRSVSNTTAATQGSPVETDAALRQRQAASVALPSQTLVESIGSSVGQVSGVTRYFVFENDTGVTNSLGIPAHSIAVVTEGGDVNAIANAIALKKPPGIQTYGTTSVVVTDSRGVPSTINFIILTVVDIHVNITIKALAGYVATTGTLIQDAIAQAIDQYGIGEYSYLNRLFSPANLSGDAATSSSGLTQAQLDALSSTYNVLNISQTRSSNPVDTTVDGAFAAGANVIKLHNIVDMYMGLTIGITLADTSTLTTLVNSVNDVTNEITIASLVPFGNSINDGANVYLLSDLKINFNEAANGASANVTLTVV